MFGKSKLGNRYIVSLYVKSSEELDFLHSPEIQRSAYRDEEEEGCQNFDLSVMT